jgi:hypothetical protein
MKKLLPDIPTIILQKKSKGNIMQLRIKKTLAKLKHDGKTFPVILNDDMTKIIDPNYKNKTS